MKNLLIIIQVRGVSREKARKNLIYLTGKLSMDNLDKSSIQYKINIGFSYMEIINDESQKC